MENQINPKIQIELAEEYMQYAKDDFKAAILLQEHSIPNYSFYHLSESNEKIAKAAGALNNFTKDDMKNTGHFLDNLLIKFIETFGYSEENLHSEKKKIKRLKKNKLKNPDNDILLEKYAKTKQQRKILLEKMLRKSRKEKLISEMPRNNLSPSDLEHFIKNSLEGSALMGSVFLTAFSLYDLFRGHGADPRYPQDHIQYKNHAMITNITKTKYIFSTTLNDLSKAIECFKHNQELLRRYKISGLHKNPGRG